MVLGVNGIRLVGRRGGVGRYVEYMLRCWATQDHPFQEIRVYTPSRAEPSVDFGPRILNRVIPGPASPAIWEQWTLMREHGRAGPLFCPSYIVPLLTRAPTLLIHHGSYEGYPQALPWWIRRKASFAYGASARRADRMVTVSESSKRDVVRFYGVSEDKVRVIPEGVDTSRFHPIRDEAVLSEFRRSVFGEDVPFILYVGNANPRRNIPQLLDAYARLIKQGRTQARLLLIGTAMAGNPVAPVIGRLNLGAHVRLLDYASHHQIATAYNAAELFIYPSSYEGFGMPVLEAMACGTPTVAMRNSAFPEFAGGVAYLAEDAEPDTLLAAMDRVLHDQAMREQMRQRGPVRARDYEWSKIARETMDILVELTQSDARPRRPTNPGEAVGKGIEG